MDWQAIWLSVRLSVSTTAILLAIGTPLAAWLAFSRRRWKFLVEAVVALPLVLPPTVLGFYVLLAIGPRSPLGALYAKLTGGMLPFSFQGLLVASVLYSLPFMVQPLGHRLRRRGPRLGGGLLVPGRFAAPPPSCRVVVAALVARHRHRRDPQLRPYHGRIRRGADGGRQYCRASPAPSPSPSTTRCRRSITPPPRKPRCSCWVSRSPCWRQLTALQRRVWVYGP